MDNTAAFDPLKCSRGDKARLEVENGDKQLSYVTWLVCDLGVRRLSSSQILELHKHAVEDIYPCGGSYRNAYMETRMSHGRHTLPPVHRIPELVDQMVERVNRERAAGRSEVECAAYALWRLNWIHPFPGGNGRTARMLTYLIIAMAFGSMPPGVPSIPKLIEESHDEYEAALRATDERQRPMGDNDDNVDLSPMIEYLQPLAQRQLDAGTPHDDV